MQIKIIRNLTIQLFIIIILSVPIMNIELFMSKIRYSENGINFLFLILSFFDFALLITVLGFLFWIL